MFTQSEVKRPHQLSAGNVILWDGHYFVVTSATSIAPALTLVKADPVNPADNPLVQHIHSDLSIMLYTWQ